MNPEAQKGVNIHTEFEDVLAGRKDMTDLVRPYANALEELKGGNLRQLKLEYEMGITRDGQPCVPHHWSCKFTQKADILLVPVDQHGPGGGAPRPVESFTAYYIDIKTGKPGWEKVEQLDWTAVLLRANFHPYRIRRVACRLIYPFQKDFAWPMEEWHTLDPMAMDEAQRELFRDIAAIDESETKWVEEVPDELREPNRAKAYFLQNRSGLCSRCKVPTCEFAKG